MRIPINKTSLNLEPTSSIKISLNEIVKRPISDLEKIVLLKEQLALGASLEKKYEDGKSLIHEMCFNSGPMLIQWLLQRSPKQIHAKTSSGAHALHKAAENNQLEIVKYILEEIMGAPQKYSSGNALGHAEHLEGDDLYMATKNNINLDDVENTPLYLATFHGRWEVFSYLFEINKKLGLMEIIFKTPNKKGDYLVHVAAEGGHINISRTLFKHGANFNLPSSDGKYPLHIAVQHKKDDAIKFLLKEVKTDINQATNDNWGLTSLHIAADGGNLKAVKALIHLGANAFITDKRNKTPLAFTLESDVWATRERYSVAIYLFHTQIWINDLSGNSYKMSDKRDLEKMYLCHLCYMEKPEDIIEHPEGGRKRVHFRGVLYPVKMQREKKTLINLAKLAREYMLSYRCDFNEILTLLDTCKELNRLVYVKKEFFIHTLKGSDILNHCLSFLVDPDLKLKPLVLLTVMSQVSHNKSKSYNTWVFQLFQKLFVIKNKDQGDAKNALPKKLFITTQNQTKRRKLTGLNEQSGKQSADMDTKSDARDSKAEKPPELICSFAYKNV